MGVPTACYRALAALVAHDSPPVHSVPWSVMCAGVSQVLTEGWEMMGGGTADRKEARKDKSP